MRIYPYSAAVLMTVIGLGTVGAVVGAEPRDDLFTKEKVVYAEPGGKSLKATLYLPGEHGGGPRPAMVVIHGGGWVVGTRHLRRWYCEQFAENGYVVMTIDYRMMPKHPFPRCLHDCKAAVRWLRLHAKKYRIDPERIAAFGASAGGHLATLLATTGPEDGLEGDQNLGPSSGIAGAISLYGVSDLTSYERPHQGEVRLSLRGSFMERFVDGVHVRDRNPFEAASPVAYATSETCPILFVHGTDDRLVPFEQSEAFYSQLRALGVATRLVAVAGRGHAFDFIYRGQREPVFASMLAFLEVHVGSARSGGGAKTGVVTNP